MDVLSQIGTNLAFGEFQLAGPFARNAGKALRLQAVDPGNRERPQPNLAMNPFP